MEMVKFYGSLGRHGKFLWRYPDLSTILLEVSGTSFPDKKIQGEGGNNPSDVVIDITVGEGNEMYVDFADGTGEHTFLPNSTRGTKILYSATALHYFQDVPENIKNTYNPSYDIKRVIKIRFKDPSKVTYFKMHHIGVHGNFPKALGTYNITQDIDISSNNSKKWDSAPTALKGLRVNYLRLSTVFKEQFERIPDWIINSEIKAISLVSSFNARQKLPNETAMDKIHLIKGLYSLNFVSVGLGNNSFADNLKSTLLYNVFLQYNQFSVVPDAIYNALQIGYLTLGGSNLESWGTGFKVGTKLNRMSYWPSSHANFPTTIPTGLENCVLLKTVENIGSYRTQSRLDAHINAWYDFIITNASTVSGNTQFRQMSINMGYTANSNATGINTRPSGLYQDSVNPSTPMEKIYKLVKVYGHTWTVVNTTQTGNQVLTP